MLLFQPLANDIVVHGLTRFDLGQALTNSRQESGSFVHQLRRSIPYKRCAVCACARRDCCQLRFLLRRKVNFRGMSVGRLLNPVNL